MRIGYLMQAGAARMLSHPFTGPAVHVREVCVALRECGHRVRIVARFEGMIFYSDDASTFVPMALGDPSVRAARWLDRLSRVPAFASVAFGAACRRLLDGSDALYERMGWLGFGGALASRLLDVPLIVEANGDHLWERSVYGVAPTRLGRAAYTALTRRALARASHIVASGPAWRAQIIRRFGIAPDGVTVVHNGTRLVDLLRREDLGAFSSRDDRPVGIAYVGGFYPWQGVDTLLNVVRRLLDAGLSAHLVLIGSGAGERSARALATALGLGGHVRFLGALAPEAYAAELSRLAIGVAPYCGIAEFVGLKLFDYKAAGLAIVATGRDGQPDVLRDGATGVIVKPCDNGALFQALAALIGDPDRRRALGRAARTEAEAQHSWRHTAAAIERIIDDAILRHRLPPARR